MHPERYELVEKMAARRSAAPSRDLLRDERRTRDSIDLKKYVSDEVGLPTLKDILAELAKPGRDPRQQFEAFIFRRRRGENGRPPARP